MYPVHALDIMNSKEVSAKELSGSANSAHFSSYLEQMASKHPGQAIKCALSSIILKNVPQVAFERVSMLILFTTNQE